MTGRIFIGPPGAEWLGDDVLRRPLFVTPDAIVEGVDISPFIKDLGFEMLPWQDRVIGAQRREVGSGRGDTAIVGVDGGGHISERQTDTQGASIRELNDGEANHG